MVAGTYGGLYLNISTTSTTITNDTWTLTPDPGVDLTSSAVGYIVTTDALCYDPSWTIPTGKTKAGIVVYKSGSSGLVVSLTEMSSLKIWDEIANSNNNPKPLNHTPAVSGKTWVCGTKDQYSNMWCGGNGCSSWDDLNNKITDAGGTALGNISWTCTEYTEYSTTYAWCFYTNGNWNYSGVKSIAIYVRPCFAF